MNGIHYDRLCAMLPTYGRSTTYLPAFLHSAIATASTPRSVSFALCVNAHDEATKAFLRGFEWKGHEWEMVEEDLPKPNLAVYFNMLYNQTKTKRESGTVVTMFGDDMEYRTPSWDKRMLDLINAYQGVGVFWANDDWIAHERCPVNLFVARDFVEATEHPFMCELFAGDMIDYLWGKVGKYTRTSHYDPDTHIWHNHNGHKPKEQWDATFQRLIPSQQQGHAVGKEKAKQVAMEIADILKRKGLVGTSIC